MLQCLKHGKTMNLQNPAEQQTLPGSRSCSGIVGSRHRLPSAAAGSIRPLCRREFNNLLPLNDFLAGH